MHKKALIIIKDSFEIPKGTFSHLNSYQTSETISSKDFKDRIKGFKIIKFLFAYDYLELIVYKNQLVFNPFFIALILFLVSKKALMRDKDNQIVKINFFTLIKMLCEYIAEIICKPILLLKIKKQITYLQKILELQKSKNQKQEICLNQINIQTSDLGRTDVGPRTNRRRTSDKANLVYLRTNLWFGLVSGGSIAHTSGVLNGFEKYFKAPIFISTDTIANLKENIKTHIIQPLPFFANSGMDVWELSFNDYFFNKAKKILSVQTNIAFIYQRYCINNFSGILLAHEYDLPLVLEYNGPEVWKRKKWSNNSKYPKISESIEMLNLKYANAIVVVSEVLKEELLSRGINADKILVNPNGVDPNTFTTTNNNDIKAKYQLNGKKVIGFIGTFGPWHGVLEMAKSIILFYDKYPQQLNQTKFLLIGDGVLFNEVKSMIHNSKYKDNVILTGIIPQEESPKYLSCCDIFLSPHVRNSDGSKFFGSPTKLFEYMALGKAIIASKIEQLSDILKHKKTAYLVKSGDINELADAMKNLLDNEPLRLELGLNAKKEVIEKYTWDKHVERIINFLSAFFL